MPVVIDTDESTGFRVTIEQLDAALTPRTKALLFVSPSNPTGAVYPREEVEAIGRWAVERGIWVVTDEIYEHLVFGDNRFTSMPAIVPELADRCVVLNGVAKTYAMTGWRVGWMIGPLDVIKATTNLQSHQTSNVSNVAQRAALAAVSGPLDCVYDMREAFERRATTAHRMLNEIPGVSCLMPEGAFYAFPNLGGLLGVGLGGRSADHHDRTGRDLPRRGQGGPRPGRGLRGAGVRPGVVRPGRRRPGGRTDPPRQAGGGLTLTRVAVVAAVLVALCACGGDDDAADPTTTRPATFEDQLCLAVALYSEGLAAEVNRFQEESRDADGPADRRALYLDASAGVGRVNEDFEAALADLDPSGAAYGPPIVDALTASVAANRDGEADGQAEAEALPDDAYEGITVPDGSLFTGTEKMRAKVFLALNETAYRLGAEAFTGECGRRPLADQRPGD